MSDMQLSSDEAREITERIKVKAESLVTMIGTAWRGRADLALGYGSWDAYWDIEFGGLQLLPRDREKRRELVGAMRQEGMSQRAIGDALGVHHTTIGEDLRSGGGNPPPEPEGITGLDGKQYSNRRPASESELLSQSEPADPYAHWSDDERDLAKRLADGETVILNMRNGVHDNLARWADSQGLFVRVDRRTEWGNPFEIPGDGDRDTVIANYDQHYLPHKPSLLDRVHELRGKALGCWCAPQACHGDVLKTRAET